jgi:hypothetical protein
MLPTFQLDKHTVSSHAWNVTNLSTSKGAGPKRTRRVSNPTALLDLWAEEMRDRRVTQVRAFRLVRDSRAYPRTLSGILTFIWILRKPLALIAVRQQTP